MITMSQKSKQIFLDEAFSLFQSYNKAKNLADDTIKSYNQHYKYFIDFFRQKPKV